MKNLKTYQELFENIFSVDDPIQDDLKKVFNKLTPAKETDYYKFISKLYNIIKPVLSDDSNHLDGLENVRYDEENKMELHIYENVISFSFASNGILLLDQTYHIYYYDFSSSSDERLSFSLNEDFEKMQFRNEIIDLIEKYNNIFSYIDIQVEDLNDNKLDIVLNNIDDVRKYFKNKQVKRFNL